MVEITVHAFVTFFVILDPVGMAPIFLALTPGEDASSRRRIALKGTVIAATVLLVFAFVGEFLLDSLKISLPAFSIAGGILLLLLAIDMVVVRHSGLRMTTTSEEKEAESKQDITVFPLAVPLIAGPGGLTSVVLLMGRAEHDVLLEIAVLSMLLLVLLITLLMFLAASWLVRLLGVTGVNVIGRVLGIILAALAVQLIFDGVRASLFVPG